MAEEAKAAAGRWLIWTGRGLSALAALALVMSAVMKLTRNPAIVQSLVERYGYPASAIVPIGIVEISCVVVYLVPQTAVFGAILITGYLGGATATHVRVSEAFVTPVVLGVLIWLGVFLRDARLRALVPIRKNA